MPPRKKKMLELAGTGDDGRFTLALRGSVVTSLEGVEEPAGGEIH